MFSEFLAQMLVLFMCILSGMRIFFIKNPRIDCFAVPAPLAFFTSLLIFVAFGLSFPTIVVSAISLLFALTNIRSCLRIFSKLIVDRYGIAFIIATLIEMLIALFAAAALIYFAPVKVEKESFAISKTTHTLIGTATTQFRIVENTFQNKKINITGFLNLYEPLDQKEEFEKYPILLFVASPEGPVQDYEPYFFFLAQNGFKILAADFYAPDMPVFGSKKDVRYVRKFFVRKAYFESTKNKDDSFKPIEEKNIENKIKGYKELMRLSSVLFGKKPIFLIVDHMSYESIVPLTDDDQSGKTVFGFFPMNKITEYETTGLGFINQTNPLFAHLLGFRRDKALFMPRYMAQKTAQDVLLYSGLQ